MSETPSNAIQTDVNQAVQSGQMADTQLVGQGQGALRPPDQQQPTPAAPAATTAPTGQPSAPTAPQQKPNPPQQQQQQPSLRSRIFDTILQAGAGTPVQDANGRPIPMTRGIMGKAIIANALAGMMAGYGTSETVDTKQGPVRVNNPGKAAMAGYQAGNQQQQQRQQAIDDAQGRAFNTVKRNLDLHASMLNLQNATEATQDKSAADGSTLYDGLKSFDDSNTDPNVPKFILDTGVTGQELNEGMQSGKYHIAKNSAILIGWQPHIDPQTGEQTKDADGIPQREPLFAVINPEAIVHFTPELKDALSGMHQDLSRIPDNTAMKAKALLPMLMNKQNYGIAQDAVNGWSKANDELTGKKSETVDVSSLLQSNPTLRRAVPFINKYIGEDPDVMLTGLRKEKDPTAQAAAGILASKLGIDEDSWKNKREADQKKLLAADKSFTLDSAVDASVDSSDPVRQQKAKNWLATYRTYQANLAADKTGAETKAKAAAGSSNFAPFNTPDALGFQPKPETFGGNEKDAIKQYNKVHDAFKKQADDLVKMEGTYDQFNDILRDVNAGKDLTGAQSVVALFNAIGISAEPLAGKGFRINSNTIEEHRDALSMPDNLVKKAEATFKNGEVVTPQQIRDYANIAIQTRQNKYVGLAKEAHNAGISADSVLPTGNGEKIDPATAKIFLQLAGGNAAKARQAATAKGWNF
jgi:hypothetical protein